MNIVGNLALLIIDAQKGFLSDPNGPAPVYDAWTAVANIGLVLNAARKSNIPVIYSQEMHRKQLVDFGRELDGFEGIHCLEGTESVEIVDELKPVEGEYLIKKRRYSCFFATDLNILLKGLNVQTLLVCGFLTDVCVHYTCVDAHQHDYYVKVLYDCVRGSSLESHEASLKAIKYLQTSSEFSADEFIRYIGEQF
jgi:biuret amidohydrolase